MKTQVSILFKGDTLGSTFVKLGSLTWFIKIFQKPQIAISIDGQPMQKMTASKEAYVWDLAPGQHQISMIDLDAESKARTKRFTGRFVGFFVGLGTGSLSNGAMLGKAGGDLMEGKSIDQNNINFFLNDGDLMKISVKTDHNGCCKTKILK